MSSTPSAPRGKLDRAKHQQGLRAWLTTAPGVVAEPARAELADICRLTDEITAWAERIGARVRELAPALLSMVGCGELTAAKIVGETAGVTRFTSEAAFARHAGVAPIPVWSGTTAGQVRLSRCGNRQLNTALHRIAVTQLRHPGPAQTHYRRRIAEGKTEKAALRCPKRHVSREVFRRLRTDHQTHHQPHQRAAA